MTLGLPMLRRPIEMMHRNRAVESAVRASIGAVFGTRRFTRRGEFGQRLTFRPAEYPILLLGPRHFEPDALREYTTLLMPGESIFDVGANIGLTAQRFDGILAGRCRIWAFEPSPRNIELLHINVKYMAERISIVERALGADENAKAGFSENVGHGGLSRMAGLEGLGRDNRQLWEKSRDIVVNVTTVDAVVRSTHGCRPSFMKIDVEGAGGLVLRGAMRVLEEFKPAILCSFHTAHERKTVCDILEFIGYRGLRIFADRTCEWVGMGQSNGTCVHPCDPRVANLKFRASSG